jgi:lysophospholipase L1-like esterase/mannose-6-phosphate isomerase-like protein (cupin superfamily)
MARALSMLPLFGLLAASAVAQPVPQPTQHIFVAGDSTACAYEPERYPRTGWGQVLDRYFDRDVAVANHAQNGRSSKSFIEQGWLYGIAREIRAGDVLLIQFGHNDEKLDDPSRYTEPLHEFPTWLMQYVQFARAVGARPILITPVARRRFVDGEPIDLHGPYAESVRALAARERVPLIDLARDSLDWLRALGEISSRDVYLHVPEQGLEDNTHFHERGAIAVACLVVARLRTLEPGLATHVIRDTDCGAPHTALADRAAQANPSQIEFDDDVAVDQPGPHGGAGITTGYSFFKDAKDLDFVFRKRVLHAGAGIGLHQHHSDEIYYVLGGRGLYTLDGVQREVVPGMALLTRAGSTHALRQIGDDDLVVIITYPTR